MSDASTMLNKRVHRGLLAYYAGPYRGKPYRQKKTKRNFGFTVSAASLQEAVISVIFTFRSGTRYCCLSPACHFFQLFFETDWKLLRDMLREQQVETHAPMKLLIRCVTERGALYATNPGERAHEYVPVERSSWDEYVTDEARPTDEQVVRSSGDDGGAGPQASCPRR